MRSAEKCVPWVRKVFLVVADETHIPKWLNTNNPKLRIVCHREFIPNELLPTFNSSLIEFFFYRIEDLSDIFITSNDDMYFLQPIPKNFFVDGGKIVKDIRMRASKLIENELENLENPTIKAKTKEILKEIEQGKRDFRF